MWVASMFAVTGGSQGASPPITCPSSKNPVPPFFQQNKPVLLQVNIYIAFVLRLRALDHDQLLLQNRNRNAYLALLL